MQKALFTILAGVLLILLGIVINLGIWGSEPEQDEDSTKKTFSDDTISKSLPKNEPGYTVLIYMNGSDLESSWDEDYEVYSGAATTDLTEMLSGLSGDEVKVVVETGGTLAWDNPHIDGSQNQRWKLENGELVHLADLGPKNMGDPQTLTDFIVWGMKNHPSNNYALIFWNHGGGSVLGFGVDELFDGDSLTLDEIAMGLSDA